MRYKDLGDVVIFKVWRLQVSFWKPLNMWSFGLCLNVLSVGPFSFSIAKLPPPTN